MNAAGMHQDDEIRREIWLFDGISGVKNRSGAKHDHGASKCRFDPEYEFLPR